MYMAKTENQTEQTKRRPAKEFFLTRFVDVTKLNAFIAKNPKFVQLTYKTSNLVKLWQLDLEDLDNWKNRWTVGHHIDGYGDASIKYSLAIKKVRYGYADEESDELHHTPHVIWLRGGLIFIALPHELDADIVITAPQVCNRADPHREPVYIWRYIYFDVLDCGTGHKTFTTREEFENWIKAKAEEQIIHWFDWHIIPGAVDGDEEWHAAVRQAIRGRPYPRADEVIELTRKLL